MANWTTLKAAINSVIKTNNNQQITGQILQNALNNIISNLGKNATFAGIAIPTTNPGTPDGPVFYIASQAGTYSNFNGIILTSGINILFYKDSWSATNLNIDIDIDNIPLANFISEVNVSAIYPTGGTGGSNKYTLETAIAKIPTSLRTIGIKCSFINAEGTIEEWAYKGGTFTQAVNWQKNDNNGGIKIVDWETDKSTTRKKVPVQERKIGLVIGYNEPDAGWIKEIFLGPNASIEAYWVQDIYWESIAIKNDIAKAESASRKTFGRILNWTNSKSETLNSIPVDERVKGLVVTYNDPQDGWKRLQYIADEVYSNILWGALANNWKDLDDVDFTNIEDALRELQDNKYDKDLGKNLANPNEFEIYGYTEAGTSLANGNYYKTGFIPAHDNLVMNYPHPSGIWSAVFARDKKTVIRTFQTQIYKKGEGEHYVRFVFNQTNKASLQVEKGTTATDYEPFTLTKDIDKKIQDVKDSVSNTYKYTDNLCGSLHRRLSDIEEKYVQKGNRVEGLSKEDGWYDHTTMSWKTGGNMFHTKYKANMAYFSTTQIGNPNGYFIVYLGENDKFLGGFLNGKDGEKPVINQSYFLMAPVGTKYIVYQALGGASDIFYEANIVGLSEIYKKIESYDILYQRKAVAQTVNFGIPPKGKEELSILFIGNSFCGQMYQYLKELLSASGHNQVVFNSVARGGKTYKYWLDDLQYKDSYPEGYLDQDNPTDDGEYDTTFDRTDTLYKRLTSPPKDSDGSPIEDRKWDIICVCGLPCQNLFDFSQDNPYTIQMVEKMRRVVQDRNVPIYLYVPPVPPAPNPELGEEQVWGNTYSTSDEAFTVTNQVLIDKMGNMGIPVNRLMFGGAGFQNLRKRIVVNLSKAGNIVYNSELTIDRLHPFYGLPYLVTSAICYQTIFENVFDNIDALKDMVKIRDIQSKAEFIGIGESNMKYAVDAVKGALLDPWHITSYLDDGDVLNINNLDEYNGSLT